MSRQVRIRGQQVVRYDKTVTLSDDEVDDLKELMEASDQWQLDRWVDDSGILDSWDIWDADPMEDVEIEFLGESEDTKEEAEEE